MTSVPAAPPTVEEPIGARSALTVSSYERTATLVIALLVGFGTLFFGLAVIFFSNKFGAAPVEPIEFVPMEATSPTANGGVGTDPEPPGVEDGSDLAEPAVQ